MSYPPGIYHASVARGRWEKVGGVIGPPFQLDPFVLGTTDPRATAGPSVAEAEMQVINGDVTLTATSPTLDRKIVNGFIHVKCDNWLIRDSIVRSPAITDTVKRRGITTWYTKADGTLYTGGRIERSIVEVPDDGRRTVYHAVGIQGSGFTFSRSITRGFVDGIDPHGTSGATGFVRIEGSWLHDEPYYAFDPDQTDGSHSDGVGADGRVALEIVGSYLDGGRTSAALITQNVGLYVSVLVDQNWVRAGDSGSVGLQFSEKGRGVIPNLTVTRNRHVYNATSLYPNTQIHIPATTMDAASTRLPATGTDANVWLGHPTLADGTPLSLTSPTLVRL